MGRERPARVGRQERGGFTAGGVRVNNKKKHSPKALYRPTCWLIMNKITYLTGKDYELSNSCIRAIDNAHMLIADGFASEEYVDDPEGPSMLAYDKRWTCIDDCPD